MKRIHNLPPRHLPQNDQNTLITTKMTKIPLLLILLLLLSVINHAYQIENNKFEIKKIGPPSSFLKYTDHILARQVIINKYSSIYF